MSYPEAMTYMTTITQPVSEPIVSEPVNNEPAVNEPSPDAIAKDIERRNEMLTMARSDSELVASLYDLLYDAISHDVERRDKLREPFVAPVIIQPNGDPASKVTGFSRDISTDGIGLLHPVPLECKDVAITVCGRNRNPTLLYIKIEWCQPFGEGWYFSGGRFIYRPSETDAATIPTSDTPPSQ